MSDWVWILSGTVGVFVVVYALTRTFTPKMALESSAASPAVSLDEPELKQGEALPALTYDEDEDVDPTRVGIGNTSKETDEVPTKKIVYDEDAAADEPTKAGALVLVTASAQTDKGIRRKKNEDSLLLMNDEGLFVVADGMGGYSGGEIASALAVKTIEQAFTSGKLAGQAHPELPRRASEVARAIQMANNAIRRQAATDKLLNGMGTTICAARFSARKQRLYVGHVGDSRLYRFRDGKLRQMTKDHTMSDYGVIGSDSGNLSRAVGIWPSVPVDVIVAKPQPGDIYLLCSDGLTKMVDDEQITKLLDASKEPSAVVSSLIAQANENGGKDNISVILIRVDAPLLGRA